MHGIQHRGIEQVGMDRHVERPAVLLHVVKRSGKRLRPHPPVHRPLLEPARFDRQVGHVDHRIDDVAAAKGSLAALVRAVPIRIGRRQRGGAEGQQHQRGVDERLRAEVGAQVGDHRAIVVDVAGRIGRRGAAIEGWRGAAVLAVEPRRFGGHVVFVRTRSGQVRRRK
jgi:hypothetical protein